LDNRRHAGVTLEIWERVELLRVAASLNRPHSVRRGAINTGFQRLVRQQMDARGEEKRVGRFPAQIDRVRHRIYRVSADSGSC
jgi:hypothetical protein